jgi:hypothetical protein
MYEDKRIQDYYFDIQVCKQRLTVSMINASQKAHSTDNPAWGQLAAELAVSLLKLEAEGITALTKNGNLGRLEQKTGYLQSNATTTSVPEQPNTSASGTNDERQF